MASLQVEGLRLCHTAQHLNLSRCLSVDLASAVNNAASYCPSFANACLGMLGMVVGMAAAVMEGARLWHCQDAAT